jgi:hypothetical protein
MGIARPGEYESLLDHGLSCGVLVDTNTPLRLADTSRFTLVERFDFSKPRAELVERVREIRRHHPLSCLMNTVEHYVVHTADVATALGLPGLSPSAARLCVDKRAMRQRFFDRIGARATARFRAVASEAEALGFAGKVGYPVFLQPDSLFSSLWATRNDTPEELLTSFRALQEGVPRYLEALGQPGRCLTAVAAEFLEGRNRSVDCLVDAQGRITTTPVVDVLSGRDIGINDFHHFARIAPSELDAEGQEELEALAVEGVRALDMTSCASHVECIGNKLGEIAGGRHGGNRARLLNLSYGIDLMLNYYRVLCGGSPEPRRTWERTAAIVTPFPRQRGTLRAIHHLDDLTRLPGYHYHEIRIQPGKEVGLARGGYSAPLYIELVSEDGDDIHRGVDRIASWADLFEVG